MTEPASQAARIIDRWPGDSRADRRRALAAALEHKDDEKVRYWDKSGTVPQREWQGILDAARRDGIAISKIDFVEHLSDSADDGEPETVAA